MKHFQVAYLSLIISLLSVGCFNSTDKDPEATIIGAVGGTTVCGVSAFASIVYPYYRSACVNCHNGGGPGSGSFASFDVYQAYSEARSRANFGAPGSSLVVSKAGNGNHGDGQCSACGPGAAQNLTTLIQAWAGPEAGQGCENFTDIPTVDDGNGGFNYGQGGSGGEQEVIFTQAGYDYFETNVFPLLDGAESCSTCHAPGGQMASIPLASSNLIDAYMAAKGRMFTIMSKASNPLHGGGACQNCGIVSYINSLQPPVDTWIGIEQVEENNARVDLAPQNVLNANLPVTLNYDLAPYGVPGTRFQVTLRTASIDPSLYEVLNPTVVVGSGGELRVFNIVPIVNGTTYFEYATYGVVDTLVPMNTTQLLSPWVMYMDKFGQSSNDIGWSFQLLEYR